jgi:hypothetical protein
VAEPADSSPLSHELPRSTPPGAERIIRLIISGLIVWGIAQAIGAYTLNYNPLRPLIVLACVAAFLGFWLTLLAVWRKRHGQQNAPRPPA